MAYSQILGFIENLILFGLILFLVFVLYKALGQKQNTEKQLPEKLRFFSEKTGQIVEMRLMKEPPETFDLAKFAQEELSKTNGKLYQIKQELDQITEEEL